MKTFIQELTDLFLAHKNAENAHHMSKYMRGKFVYFGIKTTPRRELLKQALDNHKIEVKENIRAITFNLYSLKEREFHLCAQEIFDKHLRKSYQKEDIQLIEKLITTHSWWDTVDFIAKQILGRYLLTFPEKTDTIISKFSNSDNMWLNRSAIIFQLGYKTKTNEKLLFAQCLKHSKSDEFFIQKAIGWALREYGKTNPEVVLNFVNANTFKPLSTKEAIRNIIK